MSEKTREIIALESGRVWDCVPGKEFSQTKELLSNADCVQLQVYHLLNHSATAAMVGLEKANATVEKIATIMAEEGKLPRRFNQEKLLACYESDWWQKKGRTATPSTKKRYLAYYQADRLRELLNEWDRQTNFTDPDILAYIMGAISYDSNDFR